MNLRHVVMVLVLTLVPSAAYADCESEAGTARENILASGPFHYRSRQWNKNFGRLQVGMIEPNKAEHIVEITQDGQRGPESIFVDKQSWDNDGFGWLPPLGSMWSHQFTVPESPYQAVPVANPSSWRLIENQAMLLLDVRFVQTDLWNGDRSAAVASCA